MKHLSTDQLQFCLEGFAAGLRIKEVAVEFKEMFPDVETDDEKLYRRIQKIKENHAPDIAKLRETGEIVEDAQIYLSPRWRGRYLAQLLEKTDDVNQKIKILKELRAEQKLIPKSVSVKKPQVSETEEDTPIVHPELSRHPYDMTAWELEILGIEKEKWLEHLNSRPDMTDEKLSKASDYYMRLDGTQPCEHPECEDCHPQVSDETD